jgi:hypothetical protein
MGKGDTRRPSVVSEKVIKTEWDRIFKVCQNDILPKNDPNSTVPSQKKDTLGGP